MPSEIYDDLDLMYRSIWGKSLHHGYWKESNESTDAAQENLVQKILTHLPHHGHIADIGCGYGSLAQRLLNEFDCSLTACTSSARQADHILPQDRLTVLKGNWLQQNIPKHSFDSAVSLESASHFECFKTLLSKTHQTLKPGASWIICDWFSQYGSDPLPKHLAQIGDLPPWRSLENFLSTARKCGFIVKQSDDLSPQVAQTWSALFRKSLSLPFRKPKLLPKFLAQLLKRPSLLWAFPLIRLAYHNGNLSYHLIRLTRR